MSNQIHKQKQCENGDGLGQMVFLGHLLCWACFYKHIKGTYGLGGVVYDQKNQANQLENEKQMQLFS